MYNEFALSWKMPSHMHVVASRTFNLTQEQFLKRLCISAIASRRIRTRAYMLPKCSQTPQIIFPLRVI
jgi:hypothetical protein